MFVLRTKVKLSDATATTRLIGLSGETARDWLGDGAPPQAWGKTQVAGASVVLPTPPAPRFLWAAAAVVKPGTKGTQQALPALPLATGNGSRCKARCRSSSALRSAVQPQMVNLEAVGGGISRGLLPRPEVVARSQYRGTLKRRGFPLHGDTPLALGQRSSTAAIPDSQRHGRQRRASPGGG
jgi:folate-binding Fe-S cluster repair protein YgfZ